MTVQAIKTALKKLPLSKRMEIVHWVTISAEKDEWDKQMDADAAAGKLDFPEKGKASTDSPALISQATPQFWEAFNGLSETLQGQAKTKFGIWLENSFHPSLHFKPLRASQKLWSVRINKNYRAVGYFETPTHFIWVWIGSHAEYDRMSK